MAHSTFFSVCLLSVASFFSIATHAQDVTEYVVVFNPQREAEESAPRAPKVKYTFEKDLRKFDIYCKGISRYINYIWVRVRDDGSTLVQFEVDKYIYNNSPGAVWPDATEFKTFLDAEIYGGPSKQLDLDGWLKIFNGPIKHAMAVQPAWKIDKCY